MLKNIIVALALIVMFCSTSKATFQDCQHSATSFSCVQFLTNYDGDSIKLNIPNVHPLFGVKANIRIAGIDTAEIRTDEVCESGMAQQAKQYVYNRLMLASRIDIHHVKRGKYFRIVAQVTYDGKDLGEELVKKKLAVLYDGKRRPKTNWCDLLKAQVR